MYFKYWYLLKYLKDQQKVRTMVRTLAFKSFGYAFDLIFTYGRSCVYTGVLNYEIKLGQTAAAPAAACVTNLNPGFSGTVWWYI